MFQMWSHHWFMQGHPNIGTSIFNMFIFHTVSYDTQRAVGLFHS